MDVVAESEIWEPMRHLGMDGSQMNETFEMVGWW